MGGRWQCGPGGKMPAQVRADLLARLRAGATWKQVQVEFGCSHQMVWIVVREAGGMPPKWPCRSPKQLSLEDREEISRGVVREDSFAQIADRLGRPTSTVSREVNRNGGRKDYRAARADRAARERARRPKTTKLDQQPALRMFVENGLEQNWSPEQICGRLQMEFGDDDSMRLVPETIYQALFVQGRSGLNKELVKHLRSQRTRRQPRTITARNAERGSSIPDKVMISERPAEIDDRAVPGHWEGDLIIGRQGRSQSGTLVERTTGFTMLLCLPDDRRATTVAEVMQQQIQTLPTQARRSITWDQGIEMATHAEFTIATGIPIYFCDPHAPWQRGTNENTNGLLRQYLPRNSDLSVHTQADLDDIAAELNNRPRKRLDYLTPSEAFNQLALH
jgi:transposase, IS30 family